MNAIRTIPLALLIAATPLAAQQPRQLTAEDYARAEQFLGATASQLVSGLAGQPTWLEDGRFWYRATTAGGAEFVMVDPARGMRAAAFDHTRLAAALAAATGGEVDPARLPLQGLEYTRDARGITVTTGGRRWDCSLQDYMCAPADTTRAAGVGAPAPRASVTSPDGRYAAFIRDHNLWVKDLTTDEDRQLTTDGMADFGYATNNAGWTRSDVPVLLWSPDSRKIATFQHDSRGVGEMHLVSTTPGTPRLESWRYPLPQDTVIFRIHRVIIDVESARVTRLDMPADQHRSTISDHIAEGSRFLDVEWFPDASHIAFVSSSRDHKQAIFRVANAETGTVRTVFEEAFAHAVPVRFRGGRQRQLARTAGVERGAVVVAARRLGAPLPVRPHHRRCETADHFGRLERRELMRVDQDDRVLYFTGVNREDGRDPYFVHFYRVDMDGSDLTLLTPENATHSISLSPDGQHFIDTYSTPSEPPVTVLRRARDGRVTVELESADISRLRATGWKPPEPIVVKARDGQTDLYGLMFTPTRLDSAASYPIVNYIYPGPWGSSVGTPSFSPARSDHQALAELGFVVVLIDGMGTNGGPRRSATSTMAAWATTRCPIRSPACASWHAATVSSTSSAPVSGATPAAASPLQPPCSATRTSSRSAYRRRATTTTASTRMTGVSASRGCCALREPATTMSRRRTSSLRTTGRQAAAGARRHGQQRAAVQHVPRRRCTDQGEQGLRPDHLPAPAPRLRRGQQLHDAPALGLFREAPDGGGAAGGVPDRRLSRLAGRCHRGTIGCTTAPPDAAPVLQIGRARHGNAHRVIREEAAVSAPVQIRAGARPLRTGRLAGASWLNAPICRTGAASDVSHTPGTQADADPPTPHASYQIPASRHPVA
jgi:dipeptidyl-peptidase 4